MEQIKSLLASGLAGNRSAGLTPRLRRPLAILLIVAITCLFFYTTSNSIPRLAVPERIYNKIAAAGPKEPLIPHHVWQCYTTAGPRDPARDHKKALKNAQINKDLMTSWLPIDGPWTYSFVSTESGEKFIRDHFPGNADLLKVYTGLQMPVMKSDLLRYVLLAGYGGVYADGDVGLTRRIEDWVPKEHRNVTKALFGIERDSAKGGPVWKTTFAQYALMSGKGHAIMVNMVNHIVETIMRVSGGDPSKMATKESDIVEISGPRGFTAIVYKHLSEQVGRPIDYHDVSNITAPKLFGDTLIMPINAFGAGQSHSGSGSNSPDELARHLFKGTWRGHSGGSRS
jgi:alpha 1,6-mannosyltransferase